MSNWHYFWRRWLAAYGRTRQRQAAQTPAAEGEQEMSTHQAAAMIAQSEGTHPANQQRLAQAAHRLQRQLGNQGLQRLAEQSGEPVPSTLRTEMSSALGDDLSDVRLHTGAAGADVARAAGAKAVTVGRDISFDDGHYAPETPAGRQLLAHELAHTVQAGKNSGRAVTALEQEVSNKDRPTPGTAGPGQVLRAEEKSWSERVGEAKAATDSSLKRTAFTALVHEALAGYDIHFAPATPTSGPVNPDHYKPAPAINFDLHLEEKERWEKAGRKGKLGPRTGYFFTANGKSFAVIGPRAVEASTPTLTRMHADHELFHASHHSEKPKIGDDEELEAWTDAFVAYFHKVYSARKQWKPLITYYESANKYARKRSLDLLVDYFNKQPEEIQKAMFVWLKLRQKDMSDMQLVKDLTVRWPVPVSAKTAPPPPAAP